MDQTVKTLVFWLAIVAAAFLLWQTVRAKPAKTQAPEVSYSDFLSQAESGNVRSVTIVNTHLTGQYRNGSDFRVTGPTSQDGMLEILHRNNVAIWFKDNSEPSGPTWLVNIAPLALLAALWFFMIRQMKRKQMRSGTGGQI